MSVQCNNTYRNEGVICGGEWGQMRYPKAVIFWKKQERRQVNRQKCRLDAPSKDENEGNDARYEEENAHAIGIFIVCP